MEYLIGSCHWGKWSMCEPYKQGQWVEKNLVETRAPFRIVFVKINLKDDLSYCTKISWKKKVGFRCNLGTIRMRLCSAQKAGLWGRGM